MNQDTIITKLPSRVVGGFTPARGVGEGWMPVSWETAELQGIGLAAGCRSGAPELTLDLGLRGQHTLYLALATAPGIPTALRAWLDGESGDREFLPGHGSYGPQECRLHTADLTGRRLHIALKDGPQARAAFLVYIRAEPVAAAHRNARNLIATNDGISWVTDGLTAVWDVARYFAPCRDSDFFRILWGPGAGDLAWNHLTRVGTWVAGEPVHDLAASNMAQTADLRRQVLAAAVANARDVGLEIQFYLRMEGFEMPFPFAHGGSRFATEHPQWRCRDEFGNEILRLSYAFPPVQDHLLEYYEELLDYRPDGLCFAFNRGLPMMLCEEPVLAEFERRAGRRPRLPEEADSEGLIEARTALMTRYIERVKARLDRRGMALSCMVKADETENRTFGLDLPALAERGVFESICVHSGGFHAAAPQSLIGDSPFWRALRDGGRVRIYPNGWGGSYDHRETAQFLRDNVFGQGFAGGFFWDTENYFMNPYNWHVIRQGGTPAVLEGIMAGTIPSPKIVPFTRIQGVPVGGRYDPLKSA